MRRKCIVCGRDLTNSPITRPATSVWLAQGMIDYPLCEDSGLECVRAESPAHVVEGRGRSPADGVPDLSGGS